MKRRDFMKLGASLTGLIGIERLIQAMTVSQPTAFASGAIAEKCEGQSKVTCTQNYGCEGEGSYVRCDSNYTCQPDREQVTCKGNASQGYEYECQGYSCVREFECEDYHCQPNWSGDFECTSAFTCKWVNQHSEFDCLGTDPFEAQFECHANFTCEGASNSQQILCQDFYCRIQQFTCSGLYRSDCPRGVNCTGKYEGTCSDVICNPSYSGTCERNVQCSGQPGYYCGNSHRQPIQPPPIQPPPSPPPTQPPPPTTQ